MTSSFRCSRAPRTEDGGSSGQASVELLGGVPGLLLVALIGLQLLAFGYGALMADHAAEAAALALANGRAPLAAARDAVPGWPASALRLSTRRGRVRVILLTPSPLPFLRGRLSASGESVVRLPASPGGDS